MKYWILLLLLYFSAQPTYACSCYDIAEYFCDDIYTDHEPDHYVKAIKIKDTASYAMIIEIIDEYINEIEDERILVWGDPGHLCRFYTSEFEVGDTIILELGVIQGEILMEEESIGDFTIPACQYPFFIINNGFVNGPISEEINQVTVQEFDSFMSDFPNGTSCFTNSVHDIFNKLKVYPTVSAEQVLIDVGNKHIKDFEVDIVDLRGGVLFSQKLHNNSIVILNVYDLPASMYFIVIRRKDAYHIEKFIKI